jgi:hypothetical protein
LSSQENLLEAKRFIYYGSCATSSTCWLRAFGTGTKPALRTVVLHLLMKGVLYREDYEKKIDRKTA